MAARSRHLFRMPESTLGIETLPPQSDVYIPRHLNQANGPGDGQVRQRNRSVSGHVYRSRSILTSVAGGSSSAPCTRSGKVPGQACGDGRSVGIGAQILKTLRFPSTLGLCRTRRAP
jgi:hypothetical protein